MDDNRPRSRLRSQEQIDKLYDEEWTYIVLPRSRDRTGCSALNPDVRRMRSALKRGPISLRVGPRRSKGFTIGQSAHARMNHAVLTVPGTTVMTFTAFI